MEETGYVVGFSKHDITVLMSSTSELPCPMAMVPHNNIVVDLQVFLELCFSILEKLFRYVFEEVHLFFNFFVGWDSAWKTRNFKPIFNVI